MKIITVLFRDQSRFIHLDGAAIKDIISLHAR